MNAVPLSSGQLPFTTDDGRWNIGTMNYSRLPPGRYRTRLVGRETSSTGGGMEVRLVFEVTLGDYVGTQIFGRVWSPLMIARVHDLDGVRPVDVIVALKTDRRGRHYPIVTDFLAAHSWTAAEAVSGLRDDPAEARDAIDRALDPERLMLESEADQIVEDVGEDFSPPPMVPLCDSVWAELLTAIGPEARATAAVESSDEGDGAHDDGESNPCDADEDAEDFPWVLMNMCEAGPVCLRWDEVAARQAAPGPEISCEPARTSVYEYSNEMRIYHAAHDGDMRRYLGVAWARWLTVGLRGEEGLGDVLAPARQLLWALKRLGVSPQKIVILNDANRAIRLLIPSACANACPRMGFETVAGHFWQLLADAALIEPGDLKPCFGGPPVPADRDWHAPITRGLYHPNATVPAINAPNAFGDHFTVAVTPWELQNLSAEELKALGRQPRPFTWPTWQAAPIELLCECWEYAVEVEQARSKRFQTIRDREAWVYGDTFRFLHAGAPANVAEIAVIRAAFNLLLFNAPRSLILALLGPGAFLSGLDHAKTAELVDWAIEKHRQNGGLVADDYDDGDD